MKQCSIVVLNYNGQFLLKKNLKSVLEAAKEAVCEVIVADNGSEDGSVEYLKNNFRDVKVIDFKQNHGYGEGNNQAARLLESNIIVFLNNDVIPGRDAIKKLLRSFDDQTVFAVSCRQVVKTSNGEFIGGIAESEFNHGLLRHRPREVKSETPVPQLYASGGAAAFDRKKFLALGGFDPLYAPFYWEDADLGVRAWAKRWKVIYDPQSVVEHRHESTIKRIFPRWYIKAIGDRNMFLFNWRHLNGKKYWLKHFSWLPFQIVRRPLGFLLALPKIPIIIMRRLKDPHRVDLDKLLSLN